MRTVTLVLLSLTSVTTACVTDSGEDTAGEVSQTESELSYSLGTNYGATMSAQSGRGSGLANVNAVPNATGTFSADIDVALIAAPNTTYTIQRAPEVGRPLNTDGICQRATGQYPWEQPNSAGFPAAPAFPTFVLPATATTPATPVTVITDRWGFGHTRFHFDAPGIRAGTQFDVEFRAIDLTGAQSSLLSDCFQVTPQ